MPIKRHEDICVFYPHLPVYNPIMRTGKPRLKGKVSRSETNATVTHRLDLVQYISNKYYPTSILDISNAVMTGRQHPTQKPVTLFEYLIKTYTNEGELVLDNCAGSFTTAIACINTNRNYICIEKDEKYFEIGKNRIENHQPLLQAVNV
jgi:site-specific DNA-methyltransferase (adenine-specific)